MNSQTLRSIMLFFLQMLTPICYRLLSSRKLSDIMRRCFLCLICEYDLRDFVTIAPYEFALKYEFLFATDITDTLLHFCNAGVMEPGPWVNRNPTYRLRPNALITVDVMRKQETAMRERREREAMGLQR